MSGRLGGGDAPIYTKTGDDGSTGLLFGGRVSKTDPVVEACRTLDEAVAALGLGRAGLETGRLRRSCSISSGLFTAAAEIAADPASARPAAPGCLTGDGRDDGLR